MRDECTVAANTIVLLIEHGAIAASRYNDHQLAIYAGTSRHHIEAARRELDRNGEAALRPETQTPTRRPEPRGRHGPDRDPVEAARDHAVEIRKAKPLRQLAAFFTARDDDECVDEACEACGRPIVAGDRVRVVGCVYHEECP